MSEASVEAQVRPPETIRIPKWVVGVIMCVLIILAGRALRPEPNTNPIYKFGMMGPALTRGRLEIPTHGPTYDGLFALESEFAGRPDLQRIFGTGRNLNLPGLLNWAVSDSDSGAFRLAIYRPELSEVLKQVNKCPESAIRC